MKEDEMVISNKPFANGVCARRSDDEAHAVASSFLAGIAESSSDAVRWDPTHHLRGHTLVRGCELVVIAPRDHTHDTVIITADDWDEIRCASADDRPVLLGTRPITNADRLVEEIARRHDQANIKAALS